MSKIKHLKLLVMTFAAASAVSMASLATDSTNVIPEAVDPAHITTSLTDCKDATSFIDNYYVGLGAVSVGRTSSDHKATSCPPGYVAQGMYSNNQIYAGNGETRFQNKCCKVVVSYSE